MAESVEVVVVGGGPAGSSLAAQVARAGHEVLLLERSRSWRWRACGVFSSPTTLHELRRLGLPAGAIAAVARPIPRLWVESSRGTRFALTYGRAEGDPTAVGFDRSRLDPQLQAMAEAAGARMCLGTALVGVHRSDRGPWRLQVRDGLGQREIRARILVGADGIRSRVARELGVVRPTSMPRVGLTYHVREDASDGVPPAGADEPLDGRMVVLAGAYCGFAPVPGARVNVGIVIADAARRRALANVGAASVADGIVRETAEMGALDRLEPIAGVAPIAHRVSRRAGDSWLLIGDAAGFLDPFTGEGLHRALVSARLGAAAVEAALAGRASALADYDAAMERRFRAKDLVSRVVQLFVTQPTLFDYAARRLARRPAICVRMGLLMGDLVPASAGFDPRFLATLLAP